MYIPALNEITRQSINEEPEYPENQEDLNYLILFPEDYEGHGSDVKGNVALLVDLEQAKEIRNLVEEVIERLEE